MFNGFFNKNIGSTQKLLGSKEPIYYTLDPPLHINLSIRLTTSTTEVTIHTNDKSLTIHIIWLQICMLRHYTEITV